MPDLPDRLQLRNAGARLQARAAAASRADPGLDAVDSELLEKERSLGRAHVAADQLDVSQLLAKGRHGLPHHFGVTVRDVDHEDVRAGVEKLLGALQEVAPRADGSPDEQPPLGILARMGPLPAEYQVLLGDEAPDLAARRHQGQLLDASLEEDALRLGHADARLGRHQPVDGSHELLDEPVLRPVRPRQVAIREEPGQTVAPRRFLDQDPRDVVPVREQARLADRRAAGQAQRPLHDVAVAALDLADLPGLVRNGHPAVHDAEAALQRHGLGHLGVRDAVHVGRENGKRQLQVGREPGGQVHVEPARGHPALGAEQEVVEGPADEFAFDRAHFPVISCS